MAKERRTWDRVPVEQYVHVLEGDNSDFPALATDISLTGMQLLCDEPTANRIVPNAQLATRDQFGHIHVRMRLPRRHRPDEDLMVEARCRVMAVRRVSRDEFRIGLEYAEFQGQSYEQLETFVDDWLE